VVAAAGPEVRCAGDRASSGLGAELANLTKHDIAELGALVKTRLSWRQYRPGLLVGFFACIGLEFDLFCSLRPQ
jgi:hypothetical protein